MKDTNVSVLRCRACSRSADITLLDERFWCVNCQAYVAVEVERVDATTIHEVDGNSRLARVPPMFLPRQPLRIPPGWSISYNEFLETDPTPEWGDRLQLLMATHEGRGRLVDMGWRFSEEHPTGAFCIQVLAGEHYGDVRHTAWVEDRLSTVRELERMLILVQVGKL